MNKEILRLAIPNIISNLSIPLLGAVDTAMMGHLDGVDYLGAIAIGGMIFNFVYWGFGFLRMGTTGLTAQAFGKDRKNLPKYVLYRALSVALISAIALILFQVPIAMLSFYLIESSSSIEQLAQSYFDIRIYAAPATLMLYALHGWFLGMQNARFPLYLSILVNVLNIALNLLFVFHFQMNSDGVALGTVLAQYIAAFVALVLVYKFYRKDVQNIKMDILFKSDELKRFFMVNRDIFIRTLCLIFTFSFFTAKSAEFGDNVLAVNTILLQFLMILSYGIDGFAFAAESLIGKYIGAGNQDALKKSIRLSFQWGMVLAVLFSLTFYLADETLLLFFTNKRELVSLALLYFTWVLIAPLVNSFCFIWDGIFIGATATKAMRNSMILSTSIYLIVFYSFYSSLGNHALWLAMTVFMASRALLLFFYSKSYIFRKTTLV